MKEKPKIYLVFIGLSLVICTITAAAGYFVAKAQGAMYGVAAGLIISGIAAGSLYYLPSFFMVKLYGGKELLKDDSPEFIETIEGFAEIVKIPVPGIYISDNDIPLIFTVGRDENSASIVMTHSLMDILSSEELTCAIIHEMSRIKVNQIYWQTLVAFIAGILTMFSTIALWGSLLTGFGQKDDPAPRMIKFLAMALVDPPAASLILLAIPANRDHSIDKTAVEICKGPWTYVRMLAKIGRHFNETRYDSMNPAHGMLNIVNPLPQSKNTDDDFYTLFKTHPGLDERIDTIHREWMEGGLV
ncbi:MAG: M48 family metalloprotease [ANME-2 cluster archaeon]|nr:M48 family metalloprotease [ANME-2 cluster archaeon]